MLHTTVAILLSYIFTPPLDSVGIRTGRQRGASVTAEMGMERTQVQYSLVGCHKHRKHTDIHKCEHQRNVMVQVNQKLIIS